MRGLIVYGGGKLEYRTDIKKPELTDYTALVKTFACGICNGTDTKLIKGGLHGYESYPAVLGHEAVGEVIAVGSKVSMYKKGDIVLRNGLSVVQGYNSMWGGFAEYTQVVDNDALAADGLDNDIGTITQQIIPASLDKKDATMIITLKEVYSALKRLGFYAGASVAVAGCGPVGIAFAQLAKLMGASFVALSGHHDSRIAVAKKVGADLAVNAKQQNFVDAVKEAHPQPLDFYIDAVGRTSNITQALSLIREDGIIGLYGIGVEEDKGIDWYTGPYNFKLHSVQWPIPTEEAAIHDELMAYVMNGSIDLKDYVTHTLPIEEYQAGFDLVNNRQGLKVVLYF